MWKVCFLVLRIGVCALTEESQFLSFMGTRVHFRVCMPDGPVTNRMLLLSSPMINTFHWRKILPELADLGCLTVMADLPGFGKSDCSGPQKNSLRANILWGILDAVDQQLEAPMSMWHLAAHGPACSTVLEMAALYPDSVKSQVHICPTFSLESVLTPEKAAKWFDANIPDNRRFHKMIEYYSGYPMDDYIVDRMRQPLVRPGAKECFLKMARSAIPPECGMGFCPTMALWGGMDKIIDDKNLKLIHDLLPDAETHILKNAGHFPMETHSRALRDYLRGWIRYTG